MDAGGTLSSSEDFIAAMRRFPAAVNLVTTGRGDARAGFCATAVMSLTASPPQIAVAVNRGVSAFDAFRANGVFCVNTLAAHHSDLARRFAGAVKGAERFLTGEWLELGSGCPALADAVINLDCDLVQQVEFSSHVLFVGQVRHARRVGEAQPLLYIDGDWASLAAPAPLARPAAVVTPLPVERNAALRIRTASH